MSLIHGHHEVTLDAARNEPGLAFLDQAASPPAIDHLIELVVDVFEPYTVALYLQRSDDPVFELHMRRPLAAPLRPVINGELGLVGAVRRSMGVVKLSGRESRSSQSLSTDSAKTSSIAKSFPQLYGNWSRATHRLSSFLRNLSSKRAPLSSCQPDELGYYEGSAQVQHAVGAPVMVGEQLVGVLVVDRSTQTTFTVRELRVLERLAAQLGRALQVDQTFQALSRDHVQKDRLYQASRAFATARTVEQVAQVAVQMTQQIIDMEFAALAVQTESSTQSPQVVAVDWRDCNPLVASWVGLLCSQDSLVAHVVRNGTHSTKDSEAKLQAPLFAPDATVDLAALRVMPLSWQSKNVGALIIGHATRTQLTNEQLDTALAMADHTAVVIANALLFERLERMATTDGLTGLTNRRHFMDLFAAHVARAERYGRQLSLIMCDIDHFKKVNDTYGHPVGDMLLQHVAQVLQRTARRTDVVARYGGEEFVLLMEETDARGAHQMAERIRQVVEAERIDVRGVQVACTLSLGVATFPHNASNQDNLLECADRALYIAKDGGRNQTVVSGDSLVWIEGRMSPAERL